MHSTHATFMGAPLPQHSIFFSAQTWWDMHTWRGSTGIAVKDLYDHPKPSNWGSKL